MRSIATAAAAVLALAPLLSACALFEEVVRVPEVVKTAAAEPPERAQAENGGALPGHVEPVHAAVIAHNQAAFWVSSNGCTAKEDLIPIVSLQGGSAVITLRRIDEDKCKQDLVQGVELKWSFEELGLTPGSPVSVNNPYQMPRS
jgi:hypothetical protein